MSSGKQERWLVSIGATQHTEPVLQPLLPAPPPFPFPCQIVNIQSTSQFASHQMNRDTLFPSLPAPNSSFSDRQHPEHKSVCQPPDEPRHVAGRDGAGAGGEQLCAVPGRHPVVNFVLLCLCGQAVARRDGARGGGKQLCAVPGADSVDVKGLITCSPVWLLARVGNNFVLFQVPKMLPKPLAFGPCFLVEMNSSRAADPPLGCCFAC